MHKHKHHPAADIFPMMEDVSFQKLKDDIATHGQREVIFLYEDKILDGRNRYKACLELGIEPELSEAVDDEEYAIEDGVHLNKEPFDPIAFVLSANLHRRQLKSSQRAMCAAKMCGLKHGTNQHAKKEDMQNCTSTEDASSLFCISRRSVANALDVIRRGSSLVVKMCENDELTVSLASRFVKAVESKSEQTEIAKKGKHAIKEYLDGKKEVDFIEEDSTHSQDDVVSRISTALSESDHEVQGSLIGAIERLLDQYDARSPLDVLQQNWRLADKDTKQMFLAFIKETE